MPYHQFTITVDRKHAGRIAHALMQQGTLGLIERNGSCIAYFPADRDAAGIIRQLDVLGSLLRTLDPTAAFSCSHALLPDRDWNADWKRTFTPLAVGERFVVLPPWEERPDGRIPLVVDPGMAFGTGHHETTRSCLVLMERYAAAAGTARFLDLGTGTGLLAIAARKLGFREVIAVDTDTLAIEAARGNLVLNGTRDIALITGTIADAPGFFDMIAANLISGTLIGLAQALMTKLVPGGVLVCSGILRGQDDEVASALEKAGARRCERLRDGKWVSLACRR